jgi:hypothetical protein
MNATSFSDPHSTLVQETVKLLKSIGQKNVEYLDLINLLPDLKSNSACLLYLEPVE